MKRVSEWWNKIRGVFKTQSFYVILFVCIAAVAVTAVYVTTYNNNKLSQKPLSSANSLEGSLKGDEPKITVTDSQQTGQPRNDTDKTGEDKDKSPAAEDTPDGVKSSGDTETSSPKEPNSSSSIRPVMAQQKNGMQSKPTAWLKPVDGIPGNGFSMDKLVYSQTLEQWTTHSGMDIKSAFGDDVAAVADGTVKKVYTDGKLGVTVEMDMGNGVTARYSNLDSSLDVEEGQSVKAGDVIGRVGNTALFEISDGDHLHFEVLKDGKNVDPADYIKY